MDSILLVDDEPSILSAWRLILELEGFQVLCAENGVRALEILERHLPTLVITDWTMPKMDGNELCRRISSDRRLSSLPVIVHSSIDVPLSPQSTWSVFLRKPCPPDRVIETARRLCAEQQQSRRSRLRVI
jgi:CheY-like chemotaxis protein